LYRMAGGIAWIDVAVGRTERDIGWLRVLDIAEGLI
jgi:hypothetical protein